MITPEWFWKGWFSAIVVANEEANVVVFKGTNRKEVCADAHRLC
jgi:hypothetical protein